MNELLRRYSSQSNTAGELDSWFLVDFLFVLVVLLGMYLFYRSIRMREKPKEDDFVSNFALEHSQVLLAPVLEEVVSIVVNPFKGDMDKLFELSSREVFEVLHLTREGAEDIFLPLVESFSFTQVESAIFSTKEGLKKCLSFDNEKFGLLEDHCELLVESIRTFYSQEYATRGAI